MIQTADCITFKGAHANADYAAQERIPQTPPRIVPVAVDIARPLWSVMIPVYNCLHYLKETLDCVLAQDAGPAHMQIVVVDDCSTDGDVGALVQAIGRGRICYYRQPVNRGSLRNFETCLNLATGHLVHILHGDDRVLPGFYAEIENLFQQFPAAGAAFTKIAHITSESELMYTYQALLDQPGILKNFLVQNAQKLLVQPPAIVVRRSVYEQVGGFYAVHYGEDWEMWTRIAAHFPIAYSPKCLAHYRSNTNGSITQRSVLSGQNVPDIIKIIDIMQNYIPVDERAEVKRVASREYALYCIDLAFSLFQTNKLASLRQIRGALQLSNDRQVYKVLIKYLLNSTVSWRRIKKVIKQLQEAAL